MMDRQHGLSLTRQSSLLGIGYGSVYYKPRPTSETDLDLMRRMDELHMDFPFAPLVVCRQTPAGQWMRRGFVYLAAVIGWFTRKVLAWRISITLETAFCIEAVEEAMARFGKPEIFNTDQGSQFTPIDFLKLLKDAKISISMDDKGAWRPLVDCKQSPAGNGQPDDRTVLA